jgi:glucose-1-phosphate adenylyltransferase
MIMDGNLVILAAGVSSRMKEPAGEEIDPVLARDADVKTKGMIGVGEGNRPFLDYLLFNAREAGYLDVVLVVGDKSESVRDYYGRRDRGNQFHGLTLSYAIQQIPVGRSKPLGTADALLRALEVRKDWEGTRFTVCNSDNLYSRRALKLLLECTADAALIDYDRELLGVPPVRVEQFAVLSKTDDGRLLDIIEKPTPDVVAKVRDKNGRVGVSMNIFRFCYDRILPFLTMVPIHPVRQEKELPTALTMMLNEFPGCIAAIPLGEAVPDLTGRGDIMTVQRYLSKEFPHFAW